ncbi:MAG: N-acetylglucosamine kinase [Bacteroidetes bacterium]|jgi:glucosamine kinase|nr:N-acetylglucosamine kinase [Bacteroidota bacterium]
MHLYIGIDSGGTTTAARAVAIDPATGTVQTRWATTAAGIQARRLSAEAVVDRLVACVDTLRGRASEAQLRGVVAGVAGAWDLAPELSERLRAALATPHAAVVHDGVLALEAAFGEGPGTAVIAGTGSVVLARTADGAVHRRGGWGYRLGDEGSGYALGRRAFRAVGAALDGGRPTALLQHMADRWGLTSRDTLLAHVYDADQPLAAAAPLVLQTAGSDAVAAAILHDETARLARLVHTLHAAHPTGPRTAVLFGGLRQAPRYVETLTQALQAQHPTWTLRPSTAEPVEGALAQAQRLE